VVVFLLRGLATLLRHRAFSGESSRDGLCAIAEPGGRCRDHGSNPGSPVWSAIGVGCSLYWPCGIRAWNNISGVRHYTGLDGRIPCSDGTCICCFGSWTPCLPRGNDPGGRGWREENVAEKNARKKKEEEIYKFNSWKKTPGRKPAFSNLQIYYIFKPSVTQVYDALCWGGRQTTLTRALRKKTVVRPRSM